MISSFDFDVLAIALQKYTPSFQTEERIAIMRLIKWHDGREFPFRVIYQAFEGDDPKIYFACERFELADEMFIDITNREI